MQVPFVNLKIQYAQIEPEIDEAIHEVLSGGNFIGGKFVKKFEEQFAAQSDIKYCVSLGNGTDALFIALKVLGIKEGDEVITTASSWISTASMISQVGATPVFIDIEKDYYTIDPLLIEEKITKRTKAIIPVHLYGQMADMTAIKSICNKYNLYCIEDSAQAHFARLGNDVPGKIGDIATFSFYPTKNLGAYGDAGCIVTNNIELAEKCRKYANYGYLNKKSSNVSGVNSRLDTLQAAILNVKLRYVDAWIEERISHASTYNNLLKNINQVTLPVVRQGAKHTYYVYVIRCENRDRLKEYLLKKGISTAIHHPEILPQLPAFKILDQNSGDFPVALQSKKETLSLPMYAELTKKQIGYITDCICDFYN